MDQEKSTAPPQHQVFVSFRGSDVRHNLFSFVKDALIKNGINVVTDEDAPRGKSIDENILKLIRDSRIALVIFTENYTESTWCLDELVEIEKQMDLKLLDPCPIFFEVETGHVKLQAGVRSAFDYNLLRLEHEERKKARRISKKAWEDAEERFDGWRRALDSVSSRFGLTYKKESTQGQATFVNGIVEKVKEMLRTVPSSSDVHKILEDLKEMLGNVLSPSDIMPKYPVYISIQGSGIRHSFVSFLITTFRCGGIDAFTDTERGACLDEIQKIQIERSRIALVIFTKTYMSSFWSVNELVKIKRRMDMGELLVIPIFYKVTPSDVIHHQKVVAKFGAYTLMEGKEALISVVSKIGIISSLYRSEEDLVEYLFEETKRMMRMIPSDGDEDSNEDLKKKLPKIITDLEHLSVLLRSKCF